MRRAIAEYKLADRENWCVALGSEDDTFASLRAWLLCNVDGCTDVRPRGEAVTDNGAFKGCCECGSMYWAKRNDSKFCGPTCRQRNSRARRAALAASRMASGAGSAFSSIADGDVADVALPSDPRLVFGSTSTFRSSRAGRDGGSSSAASTNVTANGAADRAHRRARR